MADMRKLEMQNAVKAAQEAKPHKCPCGSYVFVKVYAMRRISPLYTPDKLPRFIPVETFRCMNCGKEVGDYDEQKSVQKDSDTPQGRTESEESNRPDDYAGKEPGGLSGSDNRADK